MMISFKNTEKWEDHNMLSAGIGEKIRFVFTMSPLMTTKVATESDFITV